MRTGVSVLFFWLLCLPVFSQKKNAGFIIHIHHTAGPIKIDAVLDEPNWQKAGVGEQFLHDSFHEYFAGACENGNPDGLQRQVLLSN
jgi:hypothetical protein